MRRALAIALFGGAVILAVPLIAQESEEEQKSAFLQFVEGQLSTPERQISINGLEGVISSDVSASSITFADEEGIWFTMEDVELKWNRGALLIGRLQIDALTAASINYARNPIPAEGFEPPPPEAGALSIPEFPVAVNVDQVSVPSVSFGEDVFGLDSEISIEGRLNLEGGSLNTELAVERLDETGGTFNVAAKYGAADQTLDLDLELVEPENGVVANLLQIEGRPDIRFTIAGSGQLDNLGVDLTLDAGGTRALSGRGEISRADDRFTVSADLGGPISELMPAPYRPLFGTDTRLQTGIDLLDSGVTRINDFTITGGQLNLVANAETSTDGFLNRLQLQGQIADPTGEGVTLPVAGAATLIDGAEFSIDFGQDEAWAGNLDVAGFETDGFGAENLTVNVDGAAMNLSDPANRRITFNADGGLSGIVADDPEVETAFGDAVGFGLAGLWSAGAPVQIAELRLLGQSFEAGLAGELDDFIFDGKVNLETASVAPFSGIAGRDLAGGLQLSADGTLSPLTGGFDLVLDGVANGLRVDIPAVDGLLSDETLLSGRVGRGEDGITAENFRIGSDNSEITANGRYASTEADFTFSAKVNELNRLNDAISGALQITGTARGTEGDIALALNGEIPSGRLVDRTLNGAKLDFRGNLVEGVLDGAISGEGFLGPYGVSLAGRVGLEDGRSQLSNLNFTAGGTRLTGDILQDADGLLNGALQLTSTDISTAAALALVDATGSANGDITLSSTGGNQSANVDFTVESFEGMDIEVGSARIEAAVRDLFGVPMIDGDVSAQSVLAAGVDIDRLSVTARNEMQLTAFNGEADLANGASIALSGDLEAAGDGYRLGLQTASVQQNSLSARLAQPANLTVADDAVSFDGIEMQVGSGRLTATGSTGETLNITVDLDAIPLDIANAVQPDLGLSGAINGNVDIAGSATEPDVSFDLNGSGINASALSDFGLGSVDFSANGSYRDDMVRLASASATGRGGLSANASGNIALTGSGSDLTINGSAPLALANVYLANRGTRLTGAAQLNARLTGSLANPRLSGTLSTSGAELVDPETLLRLTDIGLNADISTSDVSISSFSANLASGGSVAASGTVRLDAASGFPANINARLNEARYADGNLFVATASGDLNVSGGLLTNPVLSGNIQIDEANVAIPDLGSATVSISDVQHISTPPDVANTLRLANSDGGGDGGTSADLGLNVFVSAPNQIFIRGDGLEAEVGGSVRLTGSLNNIQPVGAFELIRGRLEILGKRLDFTEGSATLVGDLDPYINLMARARAQDADVIIRVSGPVSNPSVTFASQPELPQDEVLSLLIFDRGTAELSPLQLLKLASAASELAGGGSLVDGLRDAAGIDQLDIVTNEQGNAAVQAGTYIEDNVYLSVETDVQGESRISIDLDLSDSVKARGSTSNDGETSIGIFYEQDY